MREEGDGVALEIGELPAFDLDDVAVAVGRRVGEHKLERIAGALVDVQLVHQGRSHSVLPGHLALIARVALAHVLLVHELADAAVHELAARLAVIGFWCLLGLVRFDGHSASPPVAGQPRSVVFWPTGYPLRRCWWGAPRSLSTRSGYFQDGVSHALPRGSRSSHVAGQRTLRAMLSVCHSERAGPATMSGCGLQSSCSVAAFAVSMSGSALIAATRVVGATATRSAPTDRKSVG